MARSGSRSLELELPAVPQSASRARRAVARLLDGLDVDPWPVGLVISEAVTNVVLHAYRGGEPGTVRVKASVQADLLTLVVADDGIGMAPNPDSPGLGLGLALIGRVAEQVEVTAWTARDWLCACSSRRRPRRPGGATSADASRGDG